MNQQMVAICKLFRDLRGKNIYVSAKLGRAENEVTGISYFAPALAGKRLAQELPYIFDEVFRLDIGKAEDGSTFRYLLTSPDLQSDAKDRSGKLAQIEEPNLTTIINKISGGQPA